MEISKERVIRIINQFPLITARDLSVIFNTKITTMNAYLARNISELKSIDSIYMSSGTSTEKCYFNKKDRKKVNSDIQFHHKKVATAFSCFAGFCYSEDNYYIVIFEKEPETADDHRADLLIEIANKKDKKITKLYIEVETGSRSPADTVKKLMEINQTQAKLEKKEDQIKTLVLMDNVILENPHVYIMRILDKFNKKYNFVKNENVFYRSFDFSKKPFEKWLDINKNEINLKSIL